MGTKRKKNRVKKAKKSLMFLKNHQDPQIGNLPWTCQSAFAATSQARRYAFIAARGFGKTSNPHRIMSKLNDIYLQVAHRFGLK